MHKIRLRLEQHVSVDCFELAAVSGDFDESVEISRFVAFALCERRSKQNRGSHQASIIGFEAEIGDRDFRVYPDRRWLNPIADGTPQNPGGPIDLSWKRIAGNYLDLDLRIWFFTDYYSISPGMISQTPGKGAKYMIAFSDSAGTPLSGGTNYRVKLPPNIPAANFWSVTLYEAENASGLANGQPFPSLGSRDEPAQNADGTTDLYLGPRTPDGKQGNWLATVPGKGYFAILRLYGPTEAAINKRWKPGDIERVN